MSEQPTLYHVKVQPVIGRGVKFGRDVLLDAHAQITIGADAFLAHRVMVLTGQHDYEQLGAARQRAISARPVTIGEGAWICSGAIICPGVTIGAHAVVGPGAVVMRNVPAYTIVGGNPAVRIRRLARRAT
jgi:maltose O-acetyltransferase